MMWTSASTASRFHFVYQSLALPLAVFLFSAFFALSMLSFPCFVFLPRTSED
jgi:hypothetical protein